jgi:hypothetical protein
MWSYRGAPFNRWQGSDGSTQIPPIAVGEAFFFFRAAIAATWTREFTIGEG